MRLERESAPFPKFSTSHCVRPCGVVAINFRLLFYRFGLLSEDYNDPFVTEPGISVMFAGDTEASLYEAALHGVHHGFQAVVGTQLLVDAVEMIPQRRQGDTKFAGDFGRVFGFRE